MSVSMSLSLPPLCEPQIETLFHSQSIQKGSTTFSWGKGKENTVSYKTLEHR